MSDDLTFTIGSLRADIERFRALARDSQAQADDYTLKAEALQTTINHITSRAFSDEHVALTPAQRESIKSTVIRVLDENKTPMKTMEICEAAQKLGITIEYKDLRNVLYSQLGKRFAEAVPGKRGVWKLRQVVQPKQEFSFDEEISNRDEELLNQDIA